VNPSQISKLKGNNSYLALQSQGARVLGLMSTSGTFRWDAEIRYLVLVKSVKKKN
jgi:hypothetical protein